MKNEEIRRSGQKDVSEADTASAADLEKATTQTREMALRLQQTEKQVGGIVALGTCSSFCEIYRIYCWPPLMISNACCPQAGGTAPGQSAGNNGKVDGFSKRGHLVEAQF